VGERKSGWGKRKGGGEARTRNWSGLTVFPPSLRSLVEMKLGNNLFRRSSRIVRERGGGEMIVEKGRKGEEQRGRNRLSFVLFLFCFVFRFFLFVCVREKNARKEETHRERAIERERESKQTALLDNAEE
jgi:hypothetical protein